MFVSTLVVHVRLEKKKQLLQKLAEEVAPLVKRSPGALEFLVLQDDVDVDRFVVLSMWQTREDIARYHSTGCKSTKLILQPYLTFATTLHTYRVEDTIPGCRGARPEPGPTLVEPKVSRRR